MSTTTRSSAVEVTARPPRPLLWALWLIPVHGVLLVWGTWERQPPPSTEFGAWADFVSTGNFLWSHVVASVGGQIAAVLATAALTVVLVLRGGPTGRTVTGLVMHVTGSGLLLAGFGTAAFAQPAIGELYADDPALAEQVYDAVYSPLAITILLAGAALFGLSTLWTGSALSTLVDVPSYAARLYAAAGPTFAVVGFFVGPVQTLGALLFVVSGGLVAHALTTKRLRRSGVVGSTLEG